MTHLLLVGRSGTLVLLPAEEDGKLIEDDGEVQVNFAIFDLAEGRGGLLRVAPPPLKNQIGIGLLLGVASDAADLRLHNHRFFNGAAEHS